MWNVAVKSCSCRVGVFSCSVKLKHLILKQGWFCFSFYWKLHVKHWNRLLICNTLHFCEFLRTSERKFCHKCAGPLVPVKGEGLSRDLQQSKLDTNSNTYLQSGNFINFFINLIVFQSLPFSGVYLHSSSDTYQKVGDGGGWVARTDIKDVIEGCWISCLYIWKSDVMLKAAAEGLRGQACHAYPCAGWVLLAARNWVTIPGVLLGTCGMV